MSDIVERARIKSGMLKMSERIAFGSDFELLDEMAVEIEMLRFDLERCRQEAVAKISEACLEQSRLRSLLKEAGDALEAVPMPGGTTSWQGWKLAFLAWHEHTARTVLSKIKGEA